MVDYLRKCYVTRVRPFQGSDQTAVVRWYWAPEGAQVLPGAIWRSSAWYVQDIDGQYPPPPAIGEERSDPFRWSPGRAGQDLARAECMVGDPAWLSTGIPPEALVPDPPPTPACCRITPLNANGGWLFGGRALPRVVQGGLRLGGRAVRVLLPILGRGGLRLGGVAALRVAEGGLRLGGSVVTTPLFAAGGLRLGGVAELPPVGAGGLLLGGVGRETMALLYCSLRLNALTSIPSNAATLIPWDTVELDPSGMYSAGTPTRITVPVSGVYVVQHQLNWTGFASNNSPEGQLLKNGAAYQTLYGVAGAAPGNSFLGGAALADLVAGDYLEVSAYQNSGFPADPSVTGSLRPSFRVVGLAGTTTPPGTLLGVQRFTAAGTSTYTPTAGTASVIVEIVGGGGGGGGCQSPTGAGVNAAGSGGSGGGWLRKRLTANFTGGTVVVGAGGAGGAAGTNNGSAGTASSFTTTGVVVTYTAQGGNGGPAGFATTNPQVTTGVSGPLPTTGDDNAAGGPGLGGITATTAFGSAQGGSGGGSVYGAGPVGPTITGTNGHSPGANASSHGAGGSGGASNGSTGGAQAGGSGAAGLLIIWEYS